MMKCRAAECHLLRVGLLGRQRAGLFVQSVDDGPVAADLLGHIFVFLHQSLSGELVVADVHAGDDPQNVQHPRVDVIGIGLQPGENEMFNIFKDFFVVVCLFSLIDILQMSENIRLENKFSHFLIKIIKTF